LIAELTFNSFKMASPKGLVSGVNPFAGSQAIPSTSIFIIPASGSFALDSGALRDIKFILVVEKEVWLFQLLHY